MKKRGIVSKIKEMLKLGEEGKLDSFFAKLEREFEREITAIKQNISVSEFTYNRDVTILEEKIEDAKDAIHDAWLNVSPEEVATNALQDSFKTKYLAAIKSAEYNLEDLESQLEKLKENYEKDIKYYNNQIEKYQLRIEKLNSF